MAVVDRDKPLDATGLIQPEISAVNIPGSSFSSVELDAGKKLLWIINLKTWLKQAGYGAK